MLDETALAGIAYGADVNIGQLPAIVRAALRGDTGPLIAAARAARADERIPSARRAAGPGAGGSILCNDYPTLWDRSAPIPVRLRQFEARRARLDRVAFPAVQGARMDERDRRPRQQLHPLARPARAGAAHVGAVRRCAGAGHLGRP